MPPKAGIVTNLNVGHPTSGQTRVIVLENHPGVEYLLHQIEEIMHNPDGILTLKAGNQIVILSSTVLRNHIITITSEVVAR